MRVLVAVDGSKFAEDALWAVGQIARETGMNLTVVTVVDPNDVRATSAPTHYENVPVPTGTSGGQVIRGVARPTARSAEDRTQALERTRTEVLEYLERLVAERLSDVSVETKIEWSRDAAAAIVLAAQEAGARVIAVGTHGRSGVRRMLMGSVSEAVVRQSRIPVLVVRGTVGPAAIAVGSTPPAHE